MNGKSSGGEDEWKFFYCFFFPGSFVSKCEEFGPTCGPFDENKLINLARLCTAVWANR